MRKTEKQEVERFLQTLGMAHEKLKKLTESRRNELACSILEDCQQGAIEIGNMIEESGEESSSIISALEEYCELTYQIYVQLMEKEKVNANKIYRSLHRMLIRIENHVRNDLTETMEVVFLPYKASMWDSLESIYKAAAADKNCHVSVIPIPYYDKNPDGSFREMHYEKDLYPAEIPVVDYHAYDFEKNRPDVIFIHNPYDNYNYITSIDPYFYSSNIKKFTELLVYVPYFILNEISPDDQEAVEGIRHFCTTPGVIHADRVIVQSENMRQVYIKVMMEFTGDSVGREYWEKKILGLGSPKIEKALNAKREEFDIPDDWMKIIRKPDGSHKKVVFYNTSVTALLEYNEQMLEKIQNVFETFWQYRDEIALLWRPHPLIESTLLSMRPQLWTEYMELVEAYKNSGWGIFDGSADLNRAVAVSDAYYGDASSVVQLCQSIKMPVLIQDCSCKNA